jgi:hypothetical protein
MMARESARGRLRRALGVLAALMAAPLLWAAGGCAKEQPIMPATPMSRDVFDLPILMEFIRSDSLLWGTLEADCSVVIKTPQLSGAGGQVSFVRGRLQIEKPGKIRLDAVEGQLRVTLIGDGSAYRVELPAFGDAYQGNYGDPLPAQPRRILFMPDDVVMAWDWSSLFVGKVPVLKNMPGAAVIDTLDLVSEPTPAVRVVNSVSFNPATRQISSLTKFDASGTVRAQIVYGPYQTVEGPDKKPVQVPRTVRITYPTSWTAIQIELRNIKVNEKIPAGTFDLKS